MAKITLDLNQFKASGIYTVEFDASERVILSTETIRLVVGFSRVGPFNAPVFLRDVKTARKIFGNIDTFLEKRGSFFHRSIETCLQTGPVFALNLMPLNNAPLKDGGDAVQYRSFSLDIGNENGPVSRDLLSSFYNKERFWFADNDNFLAIANNNPINRGKLLHITNLSQTPMSFIVRKPNPKVQGYAITAREWYGAGNVPEYINEFDYMEDYFLEIIAVKGDWTNYKQLSEDPVYSKYFDKNGIKVNRLNEFLAMEETTVVANFVGSIIPDFIDGNGSNQFIEVLVNNNVASTGIFLSVNREMLDDYSNSEHKVDLIGHGLYNNNTKYINFLSYNSAINNEMIYNLNGLVTAHGQTPTFTSKQYTFGLNDVAYVTSAPIGNNSGYFGNVLTIKKPSNTSTVFTTGDYYDILENATDISLILNSETDLDKKYVKIDRIIDNGTELKIVYSNPILNSDYIDDKVLDLGLVSLSGFGEFVTTSIGTATPSTTDNHILYLEGKGFSKYYEVSYTGADDKFELVSIPTEDSFAHNPKGYVETDVTDIVSAIASGTISVSDIKVKLWINDTANIKWLPTLTSGITFVYEPANIFVHENSNGKADYLEVYPGSQIYKDIVENRVIDGDKVYYAPNAWHYLNVDESWGQTDDSTSNLLYGLKGVRIRQYEDSGLVEQVIDVSGTPPFVDILTNKSYYNNSGTFVTYDDGLVIHSSKVSDMVSMLSIVEGSLNGTATTFRVTETNANKIETGYFLYDNTLEQLTRVVSKVKQIDTNTGIVEYVISTTKGVYVRNNNVVVVTPINTFASHLQFTHLSGFKLTDYHLPKNQSQLEKIYGVIENTNLGTTLASKDIISFRYIIDTMAFGIAPQMGAKSILTRLAKNRQKCLAIINAPSIKEFMESTDPRFTEAPDPSNGNPRPVLKTEYIASGGNLTLGPSFTFSLPDEENGGKFFGAFTPWLMIRENNKNIIVPPSADVSNNFIRKFLNGQPYAITAGPRRGVLSNPKLVGLEYEYTIQDREHLEPMGLNPIVTVRNIGTMIYGNQTGYQRTLSAFNNLHVRDLLITVETAIEDVLMHYLFEFNDARTRLEIKSIVESYLENVRNAGGIFDFSVIMDESNNTPETIDQNFGIIDVGIEPARGMQKFVNRITILKTGAIASGGFTIA